MNAPPGSSPIYANRLLAWMVLLLCFLCGCSSIHDAQTSGLVKLRYKDFVTSAVVVNHSTVLGVAHAISERSIDLDSIRINGVAPEHVTIVADGWAQRRQRPDADPFTVHSHAVFEDFLLLKADIPFAPTEYRIPEDVAEAMRSAHGFELITQAKLTQKEVRVIIRNILYDTDHRVIAFTYKGASRRDQYYLSGSPLVARHRDGSRYLLGIVSARAAMPINGVPQPNTLLAYPVDGVPFNQSDDASR